MVMEIFATPALLPGTMGATTATAWPFWSAITCGDCVPDPETVCRGTAEPGARPSRYTRIPSASGKAILASIWQLLFVLSTG